MNFPGENIILFKNTSNFPGQPKMVQEVSFPGAAKCTRTHQNFQESFPKILQEHIRFSTRKKYHKNTYGFPGDLVQNFVRTAFSKFFKNRYDFPGDHTPRTDILQNCLVGCFRRGWRLIYGALETYQQLLAIIR